MLDGLFESLCEGVASSDCDFVPQCSDTSTVTASRFSGESGLAFIPITPAAIPFIAPFSVCGSPQSLSGSGFGVSSTAPLPGDDMSM